MYRDIDITTLNEVVSKYLENIKGSEELKLLAFKIKNDKNPTRDNIIDSISGFVFDIMQNELITSDEDSDNFNSKLRKELLNWCRVWKIEYNFPLSGILESLYETILRRMLDNTSPTLFTNRKIIINHIQQTIMISEEICAIIEDLVTPEVLSEFHIRLI